MAGRLCLPLLSLSVLCFVGCTAAPIEVPQEMADKKGSPECDLYYGLLVKLDQMDALLPLGERAHYVRAVFREEERIDWSYVSGSSGQLHLTRSGAAFVERVYEYGKVLRETMTESERARFVELLQEGYYYNVQADKESGNIEWESRRDITKSSREPAEGNAPLQSAGPERRLAKPTEEDLKLPICEAAALLALEDELLRREVLEQLAKTPYEPACSPEIGAALWNLIDQQDTPFYKTSRLLPAYCRWAPSEELVHLDALLDDQRTVHAWRESLFVRIYELDREMAAKVILEPGHVELAIDMAAAAFSEKNREEEWARELPEILLQSRHPYVITAVYRGLMAHGEPRHIPALREASERSREMTRAIEAIEYRWNPEMSWGQVRRLVPELWPGYRPSISRFVEGESIRFHLIDPEGRKCTSSIIWSRPAHEDVTAEWLREEVRRAGGIPDRRTNDSPAAGEVIIE